LQVKHLGLNDREELICVTLSQTLCSALTDPLPNDNSPQGSTLMRTNRR
jgi:hypothetical protein